MVIEKGEDWGVAYGGDADVVHAMDDSDLAAKAYLAYVGGSSETVFTVDAGDVVSSLGFSQPDLRQTQDVQPLMFSMDLGLVELRTGVGPNEATFPFVAHVLARSRRWHWPELVAMNTPLAGPYRLGPRAHPNDNRIDFTTGRLPLRQAREARKRAVSGTHIPHPNLTVVRRADFVYSPSRPLQVVIDGQARGQWRHFTVTVIADAFRLVLPPPI